MVHGSGVGGLFMAGYTFYIKYSHPVRLSAADFALK